MFSKASKSKVSRSTFSIIGAECSFTGDILSQGEVQVDGRIDGDIRCDTLVIGESGSITGEISAESVRVMGSVTGQIRARVVDLAKSARILGDITHEQLSVEAGAHVEGRFNRLTEEQPAKTAAQTTDGTAVEVAGGPQTGHEAAADAPAGAPATAPSMRAEEGQAHEKAFEDRSDHMPEGLLALGN